MWAVVPESGDGARFSACFYGKISFLWKYIPEITAAVELHPDFGEDEEENAMNLVKCPRCDLNYIREDEKYCKICLRELKGESNDDEVELCSICNEEPALPGKDICLFCLKEMNKSNSKPDDTTDSDSGENVDTSNIGDMDSVSGMDEIIPEEDDPIPSQEYGEIEEELSLEDVREDEEREADEDEEEE